MATVPCVHCGTVLTLPNIKHQPHCMNEECERGFARYYAFKHVKKVGECEVWLGSVAHNGDVKTPMVRVTCHDGKRRDFRVLAMRDDPVRSKGRVYRNTCGTERCVSLDHNELVERKFTDPAALQGKLPITPLQNLVERYGEVVMQEFNRKRYSLAVQRGWISVAHVDEICIDEYGVNPAFIYGEAFFDA